MSTLFNNTTGIAVIAALLIGMLLGAKLILFLAGIFRGIIGPAYPPQGTYPSPYQQDPYSNQYPPNGASSLIGILLALFVFAVIVFMAKSMLSNIFSDKKASGNATSSGLVVENKAKNGKIEAVPSSGHPINDVHAATPVVENIPDFVTVQDLPVDEPETTAYSEATSDESTEQYIIKIGVFSAWENAEKAIAQWSQKSRHTDYYTTTIHGDEAYVVYIGEFNSKDDAIAVKKALNIKGAIIISSPLE